MGTPSRSSGVASTVRTPTASGKAALRKVILWHCCQVMNMNGLPVDDGSAGYTSHGRLEVTPDFRVLATARNKPLVEAMSPSTR